MLTKNNGATTRLVAGAYFIIFTWSIWTRMCSYSIACVKPRYMSHYRQFSHQADYLFFTCFGPSFLAYLGQLISFFKNRKTKESNFLRRQFDQFKRHIDNISLPETINIRQLKCLIYLGRIFAQSADQTFNFPCCKKCSHLFKEFLTF